MEKGIHPDPKAGDPVRVEQGYRLSDAQPTLGVPSGGWIFRSLDQSRFAIWDIGKRVQNVVETYKTVYDASVENLEEVGSAPDSSPIDPEEIPEFDARYAVGDQMLLACTLAYEFIVDLSAKLAREHDLGAEEKSVSQTTKSEVTERLHEASVIDDRLKGHIKHVADRRTELTHEIEQRHLLSNFEDIPEETAKPLHAVDDLFQIRFGQRAFIPAEEIEADTGTESMIPFQLPRRTHD